MSPPPGAKKPATKAPSNGNVLKGPLYKAVILYPALGNPELLFPTGEDGASMESLHLVLCFDKAVLDKIPENKRKEAIKHGVANQLKFMTGSETLEFKKGRIPKLHAGLDPDWIKEVDLLTDFPTADDPTLEAAERKFKAVFCAPVVRYFAKGTTFSHQQGGTQKLEVVAHIVMDGTALRDFLSRPGQPSSLGRACFANWVTSAAEGGREIEEELVTSAMRNTSIGGRNKFIGKRYQDASDAFMRGQDAKANPAERPLRAFDIFAWGFRDRPIATLHPVFFYSRRQTLSVGYISDLHVVSRMQILKRSDFQLVPKAATDDSPAVSSTMSTTAEAVRDLMEKARGASQANDGEVDALVIGGDLIDFAQGSFPLGSLLPMDGNGENALPFKKVRSAVNGAKSDYNNLYEYGVDLIAIYDLVLEFYLKSYKPVFILAGNHDAYDHPFGISPRVGNVQGNEGIPADGNMTILEACLVYGDKYGELLEWRRPWSNFEPDLMGFYYLLFTPVISFTGKIGNMQWISLGWGNDEGLLWNGPGVKPGHLPNADSSYTKKEEELIRYAVTASRSLGVKCMVFSHYTWASFKEHLLLDGRTGSFGYGTKDNSSEYNMGTCLQDRTLVYVHFYSGSIHYALSGHSHRAGLYEVPELNIAYGNAKVRGVPIERFGRKAQKSYLIVSDSAGPIPRENLLGEFNGWGSHRPSMTKLVFDGSGNLATLRRVSTTKTPAPRLAVAMDYYEWSLNDLSLNPLPGSETFWIKDFRSPDLVRKGYVRDGHHLVPVTIELADLKHVPSWVRMKGAVLHVPAQNARGSGVSRLPILNLRPSGTRKLAGDISDPNDFFAFYLSNLSGKAFLSIFFEDDEDILGPAVKGTTFDRYDVGTPWVVAVEFEVKKSFFGDSFKVVISRYWKWVKYPDINAHEKLFAV